MRESYPTPRGQGRTGPRRTRIQSAPPHAPWLQRSRRTLRGKTLPGSQPIHDAAHNKRSSRICHLEGSHDVAIVNLVPTEFGLEGGLQQADDLPVDVVDGGSDKQKAADDPTI